MWAVRWWCGVAAVAIAVAVVTVVAVVAVVVAAVCLLFTVVIKALISFE